MTLAIELATCIPFKLPITCRKIPCKQNLSSLGENTTTNKVVVVLVWEEQSAMYAMHKLLSRDELSRDFSITGIPVTVIFNSR